MRNKTFVKWISSDKIKSEDKLLMLHYSKQTIQEKFSKKLDFGTGGIRTKVELGTNFINEYTVQHIAYQYSKYITSKFNNKISICITFDNRHSSKLFSDLFAKILCYQGINIIMYTSIQPTPILSFSILHYKASGGIAITASHNSKEYNGIKFYNEFGSQCTLDDICMLKQYIQNNSVIDSLESISKILYQKAKGYIRIVDSSVYDIYFSKLKSSFPFSKTHPIINIVYSPLCGTGYKIIPYILNKFNYNCIAVPEENIPDSNFSGLSCLNPEFDCVYTNSINFASKLKADIIFITDPDCDRIGVMIKHKESFKRITGNQMGILLLNYLINTKKIYHNLHVYTTVVSSGIIRMLCNTYKIPYIETLTGFKNIGKLVSNISAQNSTIRFFAFEESLGYLYVPITRDKDAIQTSVLIAEMSSFYKSKNKTLLDVYGEICDKYGYFTDTHLSIPLSYKITLKQFKIFQLVLKTYMASEKK